jgi:hypothetical protein
MSGVRKMRHIRLMRHMRPMNAMRHMRPMGAERDATRCDMMNRPLPDVAAGPKRCQIGIPAALLANWASERRADCGQKELYRNTLRHEIGSDFARHINCIPVQSRASNQANGLE